MRGSLRIGRLAGIDVFVHWTFALLIGWVVYQTLSAGGDAALAAYSASLIVAVFGCIVLHELGHALMARRYGVPTRDITLLPIGGVARLEEIPDEPRKELWIALAGPAVNVVIAMLLAAGAVVITGNAGLEVVRTPFLGELLVINCLLVLFNMLPAFPMDGGRVLRALLALRLDYAAATRAAASVAQGMAVLFAGLALAYPEQFLLLGLIGLFVFFAARAELRMVRMAALLRGVNVRDAMMTEFHALQRNDSLHQAAQRLIASAQQDFPVLDSGRLIGILRREDLLDGLRESGHMAPVDRFMSECDSSAEADEPLARVFRLMKSRDQNSLPVLRDGALVGMLTADNIMDAMILQRAEPTRVLERGIPAPPTTIEADHRRTSGWMGPRHIADQSA